MPRLSKTSSRLAIYSTTKRGFPTSSSSRLVSVTFDMQARTIAIAKYGGWDNIKPLPENIREDEIVDELGRLIVAAVERHSQSDVPVGVSLSGELDYQGVVSRHTIDAGRPIRPTTYGKHGCDDIRIAAEVARIKPAVHHVVKKRSSNWIDRRAAGVWYTDGQQDFLHMHALAAVRSSESTIRSTSTVFGEMRCSVASIAAGIPNIGRRIRTRIGQLPKSSIIAEGDSSTKALGSQTTLSRIDCPIAKIVWLRLLTQFPAELMEDYKVFRKALIRSLPKFFKTIPWQKSGVPISYPPGITFAAKKLLGARRRIGKLHKGWSKAQIATPV